MSTKNAKPTTSIRIPENLGVRFDAIKNDFGNNYSQKEVMELLLSLYDSYKAEKQSVMDLKKPNIVNDGRGGKRASKIKGLSSDDKLRMFINAIMKHNAKESSNKTENYIYLPSAYMIHLETGVNRSRNVVPFLESIQSDLDKHFDRYGIDESHLKNPIFNEKDEKKRYKFITEVLKKEGISHIFNR